MQNNSLFKCCKKASTYSTCINCSGIFHKSCINRAKKNYKILDDSRVICCVDDKHQDPMEDMSTLETTIQDLTEDAELKNKHIQKLKSDNEKFTQEAIKAEMELNELIDHQKKIIEELNRHISGLQQILTEKECETKNNGTQTNSCLNNVSTMTENFFPSGVVEKKLTGGKHGFDPTKKYEVQITRAVHDKSNPNRSNNPRRMRNYQQRNKIMIVAGRHGRDTAKLLMLQNECKYMIQTILKPNCSPDILIETALSNTETFTKKDVVIIWPERMTSEIESRLVPNMTHTNLIIITQPFRFDNNSMNDFIYSNNLRLKKRLHSKNLLHTYIFECNNILRKSNYLRNGNSISQKGKWYICRGIWRLIMMSALDSQPNQECEMNEIHPACNVNAHHAEHSISLADEIRETLENQGERTRPHFLYPRLSQVAPKMTP